MKGNHKTIFYRMIKKVHFNDSNDMKFALKFVKQKLVAIQNFDKVSKQQAL